MTTAGTVDDCPASASRRERLGWYLYDWGPSAFRATVVAVFLGPYLASVAGHAADAHGLVHPLGIPVAAGSVFPYTVSISVLVTVPVLPLVGALADRSARKKQWLAVCAFTGAAATTALVALTGTRYLLGAGLFLLASIAYNAAATVYNSFLPQLADPDERDRVSSLGWALGYLGGGLLLAANLAALLVLGDGHKAAVARASITAAGLWWALFTAVSLGRLRNRPPTDTSAGGVFGGGFRQLRTTLSGLRAYPLTLLFLAAYLVYNDGIQTVVTQASLYADRQLHLSQSVQVQTILLVQFVGFAGGLGLSRVADRVGARTTVLGTLLVWIVAIGLAFALPVGQPLPFLLLGALIGVVLGGSQALSRSLFSQLVPAGKEAEYFGFYQVSADGTSWLGPLLFGLTFQLTRTYRWAIASVLVFFVAGFVLLATVPMRRAVRAVGNVPPRRL